MRATGIVRNVDQLGRIVVPKELRNTMDIDEGTPIEIFVDGDNIVLRKYQPGCIFCGSFDGLVTMDGKRICPVCIAALNGKAKKTA